MPTHKVVGDKSTVDETLQSIISNIRNKDEKISEQALQDLRNYVSYHIHGIF